MLLPVAALAAQAARPPAAEPSGDPAPRRFHVPGGTTRWWGEIGVGTIAVDASGTVLDDRTNARDLRVGLDGAADLGSGASLELRAFVSENGLFQGRLINDGSAPQQANAEASGFHAFPHYRLDTAAGAVTAPLRLGTFVDYLRIEHESAHVERDWWSFGLAAAAEPCLPLGELDGTAFDLFARVGADLGAARFRESYVGGGETDQTFRWGYRAATGLRWRAENWTAYLGYEFAQTRFGETDTGLFRLDGDVLVERQRVVLGGSILY